MIDFILISFAVFGIAKILTEQDLPFHLMRRFKYKIIEREGYTLTDAVPVAREQELRKFYIKLPYNDKFNYSLVGTVFNILDCQYCAGVWVAIFLAITLQGFTLDSVALFGAGIGGQHLLIYLTSQQEGIIDG